MVMLSTPSASASFHAVRNASMVVCCGRRCTPTLNAAINAHCAVLAAHGTAARRAQMAELVSFPRRRSIREILREHLALYLAPDHADAYAAELGTQDVG